MSSNEQPVAANSEPAWKPLTAKQRRVLGTLMEKSKTTPDVFPVDPPAAMRRKIPMTPKRHTLGSIPEPTHREVRNWPPRSKP